MLWPTAFAFAFALSLALVPALSLGGCSRDLAATSADADAASRAAVRIVVHGCSAKPTLGSGSFVLPGHVLTVAHVVAGSAQVTVMTADGATHEATVVAIDRGIDLAVLAVPTADVDPLAITPLTVGDEGIVMVTRRGAPVAAVFRATRYVDLEADDIDGTVRSLRLAYQIEADIEHGDSGAVLVGDRGAGGVVWARSSLDGSRAWATDIREAASMLDSISSARGSVPPADVGVCPGTD